MTRTSHHNEQEDEFDLMVIVANTIHFIRSSIKPIVIFTVAGLLLGGLQYVLSPKSYRSRLVLQSSTLTNQEYIQIIENWNDLLKKGEYPALADMLQIDPALLSKVASIHADDILKLNTQTNRIGFFVDVVVNDTAALVPLQKGILSGLEHNAYVKVRLETTKARLQFMVEKVKTEIGRLDSTRLSIENAIKHRSGTASPFIVNVADINTQLIELNEKLLEYEESLKFANPVQVVQGFTKFSKPDEPQLKKSLAYGFLGGAAIGFMTALMLYLRKKLRTINGEK